MKHYEYVGPVVMFGKCISNRWIASTWAVSEKKAKSNIAYQFKIANRLHASVRIELPGELKKVS